jgi:hypothetical protein
MSPWHDPPTTAPLNETTSISPQPHQRTNLKYNSKQNHPSTTIPPQIPTSPEYPYLHPQHIAHKTNWIQQMSTLTVYIHPSIPPIPLPTHRTRHARPSTTCTRIHIHRHKRRRSATAPPRRLHAPARSPGPYIPSTCPQAR